MHTKKEWRHYFLSEKIRKMKHHFKTAIKQIESMQRRIINGHKDVIHIKRKDLDNLLKYRFYAKSFMDRNRNMSKIAHLIKSGMIKSIQDLEKMHYGFIDVYQLQTDVEDGVMAKLFGDN